MESSDIVCNVDMRVGEIRHFSKVGEKGQRLMRAAMTQVKMSAREDHRILKLARSNADLAGVMRSNRCIWRRRCSISRS
ncbi:MAG: hypothetical protein ACM3XO_04430 [Bacteroidota bacterium]